MERPENDRQYESTIHLIDINHYYVGDFYCLNNESIHEENVENLKTEFKVAEIYVYVNGKILNNIHILTCCYCKIFHFVDIENLLVSNDFPMITGFQNGDIVIPCKPTSKNVTVRLIKDGDEVNIYVRMLSIFLFLFFCGNLIFTSNYLH